MKPIRDLFSKRLNTVEKVEKFVSEVVPKISGDYNNTPQQSFDVVRDFLNQLNNPQNTHNVIHIAGTSGKGSIVYMIDAMLRAHDKRTGLVVSPHVYDIRERIQFNGGFISEKSFIKNANNLINVMKSQPKDYWLSYPQLMTVLGFLSSAQMKLDYLIVETGLGGKFDSTNTISRSGKYSVLTQVGLDHTDKLGTTLDQIASQKVAIVQKNGLVTALLQDKSVNKTFQDYFENNNVDVSWVEATENYQINNLLIAIDCVRRISERDGWNFDEEVAKKAASNVYIPGRFEKRTYREKMVILDGAHNPQKLSALAWRLKSEEYAPCTIVLSLSNHKDVESSLRSLKSVTKQLICTEHFTEKPNIPIRPISATELASLAKQVGYQDVIVSKNPRDALYQASKFDGSVVFCGSFYLLGEVDKLF